jgi:hypothetical protein
VKELALARIAEVEAADRVIRMVCIPAHKARFAVKAEQGRDRSLRSLVST